MALSATPRIEHELADGLAHLAAGRWADAVTSLRSAVRREPGRLATVRALATACLRTGQHDEARQALAELTINNPLAAEAWRLAAQFEWKLAQYDQAMALLAQGLQRLPHSQVLHRQTALFWAARGKLEASARHANRSGEPGALQQYLAAARGDANADPVPFVANPPQSTADDWFGRVAQDPRLLDTLLNLADDSADTDMLKVLESRLAALLESQPYHADRHAALARLQARLEMWPAALASVERALRINPAYVEAERLRATILANTGEVDRAIDALKNLIHRGANWPDLHVQLAELQARRGRDDAARSHLYSAIQLNPNFDRAHELLRRCAA